MTFRDSDLPLGIRPGARSRLQPLMRCFAIRMTAGADGRTGLSAGDRFTLRATVRFARYPASTPIMRTSLSLLFDRRRGAHDLASLMMMVSPPVVPPFFLKWELANGLDQTGTPTTARPLLEKFVRLIGCKSNGGGNSL